MPLVTTTEMFKKAYDNGYAIGAFNVNTVSYTHLDVYKRQVRKRRAKQPASACIFQR